jgi:anthranilate synthase/aminodeoxychorismate synthase-like glutamine amidotransferase
VQHDAVEPDDVLRHSHVVLSPGPGHPANPVDFAVGREVLLTGTRPVLGVCLGMQGMAVVHGGTVARVRPAHGEVARITHDERGVFTGLQQGFAAVRYHSLAVTALPTDVLTATAWSEDGVVMGVRHRDLPLEGVQFHPESILSDHGYGIVASFLAGAR